MAKVATWVTVIWRSDLGFLKACKHGCGKYVFFPKLFEQVYCIK